MLRSLRRHPAKGFRPDRRRQAPLPKDGGDPGEEIGVAGKIAKPKELQRLIREAKGEKFDAVKYLTSGSDGYEKPADEKAE